MKFDCEKCGKIDEALLNGYLFGDRTLEGVMFKVRKNDDGTCKVEPANGSWDKDSYLRELNKEYWMKLAKEFAEQNDIFECPKCKNEVIPDDMLAKLEKKI